MAKVVKLTEEGFKKLQEELDYLKTEGRTDIAEKIKIARGYGDLSENSEYDEAKNDQAKIEARIAEIEATLKDAEVITEKKGAKTVQIGAKVKLLDIELNEEVTFKIVGSTEANPDAGTISDESPIGKALIGAKTGTEVVAEAPDGEIHFKILSISRG